VDDYINCGLVG